MMLKQGDDTTNSFIFVNCRSCKEDFPLGLADCIEENGKWEPIFTICETCEDRIAKISRERQNESH